MWSYVRASQVKDNNDIEWPYFKSDWHITQFKSNQLLYQFWLKKFSKKISYFKPFLQQNASVLNSITLKSCLEMNSKEFLACPVRRREDCRRRTEHILSPLAPSSTWRFTAWRSDQSRQTLLLMWYLFLICCELWEF